MNWLGFAPTHDECFGEKIVTVGLDIYEEISLALMYPASDTQPYCFNYDCQLAPLTDRHTQGKQ